MEQITKKKTKPAADQDTMGLLNHLPPQASDLEEAVLGALMVDEEAYYKVSDTLTEESFYERKNQLIYGAIKTLISKQEPIDILTVKECLRSNGELEEAGGIGYLSKLASQVASAAHIESHAAIIQQKSKARRLITLAGELQTNAFDETCDINETIQDAQGALFKISETTSKKEYEHINPVLDRAMKRLEELSQQKEGMSGLATGFTKLDEMTNGWQKSDFIIIAARPAMGKTAFSLSMLANIAVRNRIPVAMFSLEMQNVQLVNRLISNVCEIGAEKLRKGDLQQFEWQMLDAKIGQLRDAPVYLDQTEGLTIGSLRSKALKLKSEHDIQLIIIDYLQLMNSGMRNSNRQEEISVISRNLKALAKELNIPVIALSQLNRNVETREGYEGKRPQLSDLRESGSIEQDADIVCMIHRPEYYKIYEDNYHNDLHGVAEIIIAKHRNGSTGDVRLAFQSTFARFDNLESRTISSKLNKKKSANNSAGAPSIDTQAPIDPLDSITGMGMPSPSDYVPY